MLMNASQSSAPAAFSTSYPMNSLKSPLAQASGNFSNQQETSSSKVNPFYMIAPELELLTAFTFLLRIPFIKSQGDKILKKFPENPTIQFLSKILPKISNPRTSNRLLVGTVLLRSIFNSSIGINQQQAGMILTNMAGIAINVPLMILMEIATRKHGSKAADKYSKILALINLMLTGVFTTGFVQKARRDNDKVYYTHDMRNLKEIFDLKNSLTILQRIQRSGPETERLIIDSGKAYSKAAEEMAHSLSSQKAFKAFLNPVDSEGTPGRVAFSAFTMPLGALIALANVKNNFKISLLAATVSILGNLENGLALARSSWEDKEQPLRWLGVLGGLTSPLAEAILTSKNSLGPAAMTSSNAFQNLYQATAWSKPTSKRENEEQKTVVFNQENLLAKPETNPKLN